MIFDKKLTNKEIFELHDSLTKFVSGCPNLDCEKLYFAVKRNLSRSESVIKKVRKGRSYHNDTDLYNQTIQNCLLAHSKKDENGKPIIKNGAYEYKSRIAEAIKTIEDEFRDVIEFNKKADENFEVELEKKNKDFEIFYLKRKDLKDSKGNILPMNWGMSFISDILID